MGKTDIAAREYLSKNDIFSDIFNYYLYQGEQVILAENLRELDTTGIFLSDKGETDAKETRRDLLKLYAAKSDKNTAYVILGLEEQTNPDYTMPARIMLYDALRYEEQIKAITRNNKKIGKFKSDAEFLGGFRKTDRLIPVITLIIYMSENKWDAPMSLYEMLDISDKHLLTYIQNYRLNLLAPQNILNEDFDKFHTEIGAVLEFMKNLKQESSDWMKDNPRMQSISKESANLIKTITNIEFNIPNDDKEGTNMVWVAYENAKKESLKQGREEGRLSAILNSIRNLMKNAGWSKEEAMNMLNLSASDRKIVASQI